MALSFGKSKSSTNTTSNVYNFANYDNDTGGSGSGGGAGSSPLNLAGLSVSAGKKGTANLNIDVTQTDHGAIAAGLGFAEKIADQSFGFAGDSLDWASEAVDRTAAAYNNSRDALQSAFQQSLDLVSQSREPADEKTREQFANMTYLLLAVVGFVAWVSLKGN